MNDIYGGSRHTPINPMEELPENSFDSMFEQARNENLMNNYYSCPADYVMSLEEDEFSDEEVLDQHGPFEKLDFLKDKIGHLAVFLHYLISNEDPTPLYFWYVTDVYSRETATTKELKKWAYEIFSTFVAQNSPLKVSIGGEAEEKVIADALNDPRTTEERLRDIFSVARMRVHDDLENILTDFRNRRTIGLGCLFGDRQLEDNMDRAAELKIVETTLMPHLDTLLGDADSSSEIQNDKNIAMASAIATLMKTAGVSPGKVSGMKGSSLEKCRCFVEKEKSSFMSLKPKRGKAYFQGHQFVGAQYSIVTFCDVCRNLLWGIGTQGFKCQGCDINVHRRNCMDNIKESCPAIHKKVKKTYPDRKTQEIDYSPRPTRTEMEDKHQDSLVADSPRPRGASMNEEYEREERKTHKKSGSRSDIDYDEMVGESEKESENRPETPIEEPPTPKAARTLGYRQKKKENWYASKAKVNYKEENGGQSPSPSNQIESPTPDSDEDSRPDSDLDIEGELPNWQTVADKKIIRKLNRKEIKRQEVIHELIHTEKTHVRNLKVLHRVFYKVIKKSNILTHEELHTIFPNLEELIERHESLSRAMKEREKESDVIENIGDIMSDRFDGDAGEQIKESCATFCRNLKNALELMKNLIQTKKDFQILMNRQEESHYCRRLKFPDIMAKTHQRLVKYPLLLENINKSTPVSHSDYKRVERCARCCKDILNHVNNEIRRVEDEIRLKELARKIEDKRSIIEDSKSGDDVEGGASVGKFDILKHKLEMEGDLVWKISPTKRVDLHVVLLNDTLVLLQKQDEKYILKTHTTTQVDNKGLNPVIRLANTLIREVATDRKAFFLVSTSLKGSQIYELVAQTYHEKKIWMDRINNATELNRAQDIFAERGRRGGILMTAPSPLVPPVEEELKGNDEQEKDIDKEKEDSEELMSDEKQSVEYSSSPVPESDSAINQELPSKERLEELQVELKQNYEDIKCLIERRSNILAEMRGEKNWEPLSESATHPRDLVVTAIGQAHHLSTPIKDILNPSSVSDQQRTTISQSISTLQKCLTDVLNAVYSNDDHRKPSVDKYDSSGKTTPQDLEGIPLKNENMDFNDSRYSPIDDSAVSVSPPPPITVSEVASLNEDTRERSSTKSNINGMMSSNESTSSSRLSSVSHEDSPQKVETGLLITSPFKMLRKRATTDPSTDTSARPQRSTRECTSSPVSVTQSDYSDSE